MTWHVYTRVVICRKVVSLPLRICYVTEQSKLALLQRPVSTPAISSIVRLMQLSNSARSPTQKELLCWPPTTKLFLFSWCLVPRR